MGQLLRLGHAAGKAAPGVPLGPAGKVLGVNAGATDRIDIYPPGFLTASDVVGVQGGQATPTNETSLIVGGAIANGWPAGAAVHDMLHCFGNGTWTNGSTGTFTFNLYIAGVIVAGITSTSLGPSTRQWSFDLKLACSTLGGGGAGLVKPSGFISLGAVGTGFQIISTTNYYVTDGTASPTLVTNAAGTVDLKGKMSVGTNPATSFALNAFQARWFPKNY